MNINQIDQDNQTHPPLEPLRKHCRQEADTANIARSFADLISQLFLHTSQEDPPSRHINVALEGNLGSGKTTFARYLIQALGHDGSVKSPTYNLCEPYLVINNGLEITIHHFDLYRMQTPLEWEEAGFAEYFDSPGVCLVEWPEKAEGTLPAFDISVRLEAISLFSTDDSEREITLEAKSASGEFIISRLYKNNGTKFGS